MQSQTPVKFTVIQMPCCGTLLCWVNPRRMNFCPECGTASPIDSETWEKGGEAIIHRDNEAIIISRQFLQENADEIQR